MLRKINNRCIVMPAMRSCKMSRPRRVRAHSRSYVTPTNTLSHPRNRALTPVVRVEINRPQSLLKEQRTFIVKLSIQIRTLNSALLNPK